jgi:ketosteroid isomerase-like protein
MNDQSTLDIVNRFNDATNRHDVDEMMNLMSENVVFESTGPAPDGKRIEGGIAVRKIWEELFQSTPEAKFTAEELFECNDRCVVRWRYDFEGGHIRGVDVFKVKGSKIVEKLSYVKG